MEPKHGPGYWIDRFQEDRYKLEEGKKIELTRALLIHGIPLQPEDADFFLSANPNSTEIDKAQHYSSIERKVARAYSARKGLFNDSKLRDRFLADFRTILTGFYTQGELDEIIPYIDNGEALVVMMLVGGSHPASRRIRNAYLPEITSLVEVHISPEGKHLGGRDITHALFDGEGDAVSQIERLIGDV